MAALTAIAKTALTSDPTDIRTLDQSRADVLVDLIIEALNQWNAPTSDLGPPPF